MPTTWVLIADGARARVLAFDQRHRRIDRDFVEEIVGSTAPSREIASDRPGRSFDSGGLGGRHAMEPGTDPQRHAKLAFARELVQRLEQGLHGGQFDDLALIAAPQTLGDLRALLPKVLADRVVTEVAKDLVNLPLPELRTRVGEILQPA
jgi:protein required for attachment to host cells